MTLVEMPETEINTTSEEEASTICGAFKEWASLNLGKPHRLRTYVTVISEIDDGVEVLRLRSEHALLNVLAAGNYGLRPV